VNGPQIARCARGQRQIRDGTSDKILPTKLVKIIMRHSIAVVAIQPILQLNQVVYGGITGRESRPMAEDEDIGALLADVGGQSSIVDIVICRTSVLLTLLHGNHISIA
jgi:hypothetical protein